jgi:hypothetical protein
MSQFRNVSADERAVVYGLDRAQSIPPDGLVTVADDVDDSYRCQPDIWKIVPAAAPPAPSVPKPAKTDPPEPAPAS